MTAFGTGNHNFPLSFWHTANGVAVGAGKIFVVLIAAALLCLTKTFCNGIIDLVHKPGVFSSALWQIAGEHAEDCPNQQNGGECANHNKCGVIFQEHRNQVQHNGCNK